MPADIFTRIAKKKKQLDELRPFDATQVALLKEQLAIEYIYNSTSIEGNTLTLNETKLVLQEGITIGGKPLREHLDVQNQQEALTYIESILKKKRIREVDILKLHSITLKGISDYWAGRYKTSQNRIIGSRLKTTPPYKVHTEMKQLVRMLREKMHPVVLAAKAHHELVRIHPFVDGNGRTARLLTNLLLMKHGYAPIIIQQKDRKKYFAALEQAHRGDVEPFQLFIARAEDAALLTYLNALRRTTKKTELLPLNELTGVYSQEYLSFLARRGMLSATKINGIWHSTRDALQEYIASKRKYRKK
ncbi:MAG: Fic family protein [Candidatus Woesearchaeota archaeon]|nr:Fic family protein [Candidatus Woesearchaeota archaeon]